MRLLALIAARGGSKRLPGKNLKQLGGRPLIAWTIERALRTSAFCDVLVSTDDSAIASVARERGALVPWLRPAALATESATSAAVARHALDWYERAHGVLDGLVLLQPTSPFRSLATIRRGLALFVEADRRPVIAVTHAVPPDGSGWWITDGLLMPSPDVGADVGASVGNTRVRVTGALYIIAPCDLRKHGTSYGAGAVPLFAEDAPDCVDIDTLADWERAEALMASDERLNAEDANW